MTKLQEAVLLEMRLRGFSPRTVESYIYTLKYIDELVEEGKLKKEVETNATYIVAI